MKTTKEQADYKAMKELIEKLERLKDLIEVENEVDVDSSIKIINEAIQALTSVESESAEEVNILDKNLLFKFKDEHNTAEITLSMRDIWANVQAYVYDKLESGLPSCNCTNESNPFCECPPIYEEFELSSISMHDFANAEKKQQWISVKDRLPEMGQLVVINRDIEVGNIYTTIWSSEEERYMKMNDITHWMPLPEPPTNI